MYDLLKLDDENYDVLRVQILIFDEILEIDLNEHHQLVDDEVVDHTEMLVEIHDDYDIIDMVDDEVVLGDIDVADDDIDDCAINVIHDKDDSMQHDADDEVVDELTDIIQKGILIDEIEHDDLLKYAIHQIEDMV